MNILKDLQLVLPKSLKCLVASAFMMTSFSASASPLNLDLTVFAPDVTSNYISTDYDAGTDIFTATGFTATINDGVNATSINGTFSLTANISAGGILNSGTISADDGTNTLITGNLFDFGFSITGGQTLEFLFETTGGTLESDFLTHTNGIGGLIINFSGYNGDSFNSNFSAIYTANSDFAPVPVPAALWLFGSGLLAIAGLGRRKTSLHSNTSNV